MPGKRKKGGHHQSARAHHIFRALKKKNPSWSKSHTWAAVMGMSPRTLRIPKFKTTSRRYSITHKRAAIARKMKTAHASKAAIYSTMRSMDKKRTRKGRRRRRR